MKKFMTALACLLIPAFAFAGKPTIHFPHKSQLLVGFALVY